MIVNRYGNIYSENILIQMVDDHDLSVMAKVGDNILRMRDHLADVVNIKFEWNEGNHFKDAEIRTAKAFAWVIGQKNTV